MSTSCSFVIVSVLHCMNAKTSFTMNTSSFASASGVVSSVVMVAISCSLTALSWQRLPAGLGGGACQTYDNCQQHRLRSRALDYRKSLELDTIIAYPVQEGDFMHSYANFWAAKWSMCNKIPSVNGQRTNTMFTWLCFF